MRVASSIVPVVREQESSSPTSIANILRQKFTRHTELFRAGEKLTCKHCTASSCCCNTHHWHCSLYHWKVAGRNHYSKYTDVKMGLVKCKILATRRQLCFHDQFIRHNCYPDNMYNTTWSSPVCVEIKFAVKQR